MEVRAVYGSTGRHEVVLGGLRDDPQIPALAAIARRGVAAVLTGVGVAGASGGRVVKHHPGSRCTLYASTARGPVAIKAYANDVGPVVEAQAFLAGHGLAAG